MLILRTPTGVACQTAPFLVFIADISNVRPTLVSLSLTNPPLTNRLVILFPSSGVMFYDVSSQAFASFLRSSGSSKYVGRLVGPLTRRALCVGRPTSHAMDRLP